MSATRSPVVLLPALALLVLPSAAQAQVQAPTPTIEAPAEGATEREIEAELDRGADQRIATRLSATFDGVEALRDVTVAVDAGVVRLAGEVPDAAARELAGQLARQIEGVALVENEIREVTDIGRRLGLTFERLRERGLGLLALLPLLVVAGLVVALFFMVGTWLSRRSWPFRRIDNGFLRQTARRMTRGVALLIGTLVALDILGATAVVAAVLGTAGLFGLVIGFAFRDLAENAIASLLLSLRQPFAPNDLVMIEGSEGHVVSLNSRATVLLSLDGNHVRIPNALVYKGVLVNYSRNPLRRFDFVAGVGVDDDLTLARSLGIEILRATPGVLADPSPEAFIEAIGDSNVRIRYIGWADQRASDFLKVKSEAIRRVKEALDEAGISLPEPAYIVRLRREREGAVPETAAARPAPVSRPADVGRENVLERQAAAERQAAGPDLLDPEAPREL